MSEHQPTGRWLSPGKTAGAAWQAFPSCNSYAKDFGLTGCRRSVPHLQRMRDHLDDELGALEKATGV